MRFLYWTRSVGLGIDGSGERVLVLVHATPAPSVTLPAAPDIPQWTRSAALERREGVAAARGLLFATLFAVPVAGLVAGIVWLVESLVR